MQNNAEPDIEIGMFKWDLKICIPV